MGIESVNVRSSRNAVRAVMYAGDFSARNFLACERSLVLLISPTKNESRTHCELVEARFERVVGFPEGFDVVQRDTNSSLVDLSQSVHLLLFLPCVLWLSPRSAEPHPSELPGTNLAFPQESDVFLPYIAALPVHSALLQCNFVGIGDGRSGLLDIGSTVRHWILPADIVEVCLYKRKSAITTGLDG